MSGCLGDICLTVILFLHKHVSYFQNSCELFSSMITCGNELHCVRNYFLLLEPVLEHSFIFVLQIVSNYDFLLSFVFFLLGYLCAEEFP